MTESEWRAARGPDRLIDWLFFDTSATERKLRLFAAACCRRVELRIVFPEAIDALACVEHFADELVSEPHTAAIYHQALQAYLDRSQQEHWHSSIDASASRAVICALSHVEEIRQPDFRSRSRYSPEHHLYPYPCLSAEAAADVAGDNDDEVSQRERREGLAQVYLLHDIFGPLPFRNIAASPSWLTSDMQLLAQGIYDEKAFSRMPILADALQDAGCDNEDILNHCRAENWEHVRGCWVIDLLLGRPWREES